MGAGDSVCVLNANIRQKKKERRVLKMGAKNIMTRQWAKLNQISDDNILQGPISILKASVPS